MVAIVTKTDLVDREHASPSSCWRVSRRSADCAEIVPVSARAG